MKDFRRFKHYDEMLERTIIGAILLEGDAIHKIYGLIEPIHFYDDRNAFLLKKLFEMKKEYQKIDLLTLFHHALKFEKEWNKISKENIAYYASLCMFNVVSSAHIDEHCKILRNLYVNRKALEIQMNAGKDDDGPEALYQMQKQIDEAFAVMTINHWESASDVVTKQLLPHMDRTKGKGIIGLPTGIKKLTDITGGLQNGHLIVIGARPSIGKTAIAGTIALAACEKVPVGVVLLEMPNAQYAARLISQQSEYTFKTIWENKFNNLEYEDFMLYAEKLSGKDIWFTDKPTTTMTGIQGNAYQLLRNHGLGLLIIDYLQLIGSDEKNVNREREVAKISRGCKILSMELDIPVILLCQLNRGSELTGDKKPRLHNLRESGAIEQDADEVFLLHRDKEKERLMTGRVNFPAWLLIEKQRNGPLEEIELSFNGSKMLFEDAPDAHIIKQLPDITTPPVKPYHETEKDNDEPDDNGFDDGFNEEQLF